MSWIATTENGAGLYQYLDKDMSAIVSQRGELWEQAVYYRGRLWDFGTWDSREVALRNAKSAIRRCGKLLSPLSIMGEDDDDEDS